MVIAECDGVILRHAGKEDLPRIYEITVICYEPIQASFREIVGETFCSIVMDGPWQERKINQVGNIFAQNPENLWVLVEEGNLFGYVSFIVRSDHNMGIIDNNGILPGYRNKGWGKFMYREVLKNFKDKGLKIAMVETDLDAPHLPARHAYEAVGFNRQHRIVNYIQDLT
jgi:GNAT superfamily N-acetyltransferase